MLTHGASVHLRYVLLLNVIAGLVPSLLVKGRANDPLLYATWWTHDQHSAVLVVSATAIVGTVLVYVLLWRNLRRWWTFVLCGMLTSTLPGLFYLAATPPLPDQVMGALIAMVIVGVVWGALVGLIIYAVVGKPLRAAGL